MLVQKITYRGIFWLLIVGYFFAVYANRLVEEGMFGDGLTYASIARNMAIGKGSFWAPFFSSSFWLSYNTSEVFYEHPPLAMFLLSLLFRLFGDQLFVEKLYCVLVFASCIWCISSIWKELFKEKEIQDWDWLPVLFWITMPEVEWTTANNMLDNTQAMFGLIAVYLYLKSLNANTYGIWLGILSGISIFFGFLSKGPVSFFVLGLPLFNYLFSNKQKGSLFSGLGMYLGCFLPLMLCFLNETSAHFLSQYINQQFLSALMGKREVTEPGDKIMKHLHIFKAIYSQILLSVLVVTITFGIALWRKGVNYVFSDGMNRRSYFYVVLLLAISGSFPIALSVKQADYYLLPSTPYYALTFACLLVGIIAKLYQKPFSLTPPPWLAMLMVILVLGTVGFASSRFGKPRGYEKDIIHDVHILSNYIPKGSKVWVCDEMMKDFNVHTYLQRYLRIELTTEIEGTSYFLNQSGCSLPDISGKKIAEPFQKFGLMVKK